MTGNIQVEHMFRGAIDINCRYVENICKILLQYTACGKITFSQNVGWLKVSVPSAMGQMVSEAPVVCNVTSNYSSPVAYITVRWARRCFDFNERRSKSSPAFPRCLARAAQPVPLPRNTNSP